MAETITLQTDKGPFTATYSNDAPFLYWAGMQAGFSHHMDDTARLKRELLNRSQNHWNRRFNQGLYKDLPPNPMCIEIGGGIAINAIISAQYIPGSQWQLIDADSANVGIPGGKPWSQYTEDGSIYYNPKNVVLDGISSSGLPWNRFTLNPLGVNPWPKADLIMSAFSWCYHYPTEVYLDKVVESLNPGGKLWITYRANDADDSVSKISEALGVEPTIVGFHKDNLAPHLQHLSEYRKDQYWLKECLWIRPK